MPDLTGYDDEALDVLRVEVLNEQERRRILADAPAQADEVAERYRAAAGIADGSAWVQPTGAHDAVPPGETRVFEGDLWRNISGTVLSHSPTEYPAGWEKVTAGVPDPEPPAGKPWSGASVAYKVGDLVTYGGKTYRIIQAHTSQADWTPDIVPALYSPIATTTNRR